MDEEEACLMAASPVMLEALEQIRTIVQASESDPEAMADMLLKIGTIADAAVAKARPQ